MTLRRFPTAGSGLANQPLSESPDEGAAARVGVDASTSPGMRPNVNLGRGVVDGPIEESSARQIEGEGTDGRFEQRLTGIEERQRRIEELLVQLTDTLQHRG